ncbi:hypothetical protein [Rhizobium paknamense]|uniref:Alanine and proline-rich secreted protein Apa n=1 Tax=Rhizobium paknamense TaxID=1206817 RepID=A0ABU0I7H8_9HYPH|nr:hypothetical protein [Rhizobium paknamense]MDQ0454186.1 hypothetical protein [Rhizobium paknamense]
MQYLWTIRRATAGRVMLCAALLASSAAILPAPALALSELQGKPQEAQAEKPAPAQGGATLPQPEPVQNTKPATPAAEAPAPQKQDPPVEVIYDISKAPEAVRKMRERMVEAAASGDPERLRELITQGKDGTQLALGEDNGSDPIQIIKSVSGDPDGLEVLAIMLDVLSTGFAHVNAGTPDEAYVWPYFAEKPLNTLTAPEKVELMRLVTAGDFENMLEYGNYNFFRIGISPNGQWKFFSAGD